MPSWVRASSDMGGLVGQQTLGAGLVRKLTGCPSWVVVPTGELKDQSRGCDPVWPWLQGPLTQKWTGSGVCQIGLDSRTHWCS